MRRTLRFRPVATLCAMAVVTLAGCASTSVTHLHTLLPIDPPTRASNAATLPPILLDAVRVPAQVDQPQWLIRLDDGSAVALEQERWAGPLRDEIHAALLERLVRHHGALDVRGGASPPAYVRVSVELRRFESAPGRLARIEGSWVLTPNRGGAPALRCNWLIDEAVGAGMPALASGHRRAIARLSDSIALNLPRVATGQPADCAVPAPT